MPPLPPPHVTNGLPPQTGFIIELVYASIIIAICLLIYFKTKELYQLSNHKGILFFRNTFLFFALAYFFRFIPLLFKLTELHQVGHRLGFTLGFFLFSYASSMAVISLARSVTWKKIKKGILSKSYIYHLFALVIASVTLVQDPHEMLESRLIFFIVQVLLITGVFIITVLSHKKKKQSNTYLVYLLLLLFWTMNLAIISIPKFMTTIIYLLYLCSLSIFMVVLYKTINIMRRK